MEHDEVEQIENDDFFLKIIKKLVPDTSIDEFDDEQTQSAIEAMKHNRDFCYRKSQIYCRAMAHTNYRIGELSAHAKRLEAKAKIAPKPADATESKIEMINKSDLPALLKLELIDNIKKEQGLDADVQCKAEHYDIAEGDVFDDEMEVDKDEIDELETDGKSESNAPKAKRLKSSRVTQCLDERKKKWQIAADGDDTISDESFDETKADKREKERKKKV